MSGFLPQHAISVRLHCLECRSFGLHCPTCGEPATWTWPDGRPALDRFLQGDLVAITETACPCGAVLTCGIHPTLAEPQTLSDRLPIPSQRALLERAWQLPNDTGSQQADVAIQDRPRRPQRRPRRRVRPQPQPKSKPAPPKGGERRPLSRWRDLPRTLVGIAPATVARIYRQLWGLEPHKWRQTRIYSLDELGFIAEAVAAEAGR